MTRAMLMIMGTPTVMSTDMITGQPGPGRSFLAGASVRHRGGLPGRRDARQLLHGRHLDVLSVGDEEARALGMHPGRVRLIGVAACALAAASAVAVSGLIGFVGIIVPHVVRRLAGTSYRLVLPLSLLAGAGFLVLADTLARTVLSPAELPIGVVTALIGSPVFIWILHTTRAVRT